MPDLLADLAAIVGAGHVLTLPQDTAPYTLDYRRRYQGQPLAVVLPGSTAEVAALLRLCQHQQVAVVPQGGNTSTCGAATPDNTGRQLVIAMQRMNRLRAIDTANNSITVEAGMTLAVLQQLAVEAGRLFPLSLASEGSCQIGGNLSTNAGGLAVLRYGTMRELALGLEVVLPDGRVLHQLSGLRKDTSGLDVKQLFIGAEGQLGLITAATLKLFPLPGAHATAWLGVDSSQAAINLLSALRQAFGDRLTTFEIMSQPCQQLLEKYHPGQLPFIQPWAVLAELSDSGDSHQLQQLLVDWLATQNLPDGVLAHSEADRQQLWQLREAMSETQKRDGPSIKHDIGLPSSAIPAFLEQCATALSRAFPTVRIIAFGHAGDGNLHYNISYTRPDNAHLFEDEDSVNAIVYDLVYRHQGTLAAEHGIGQLKGHWLQRYQDPTALQLMRGIKQLLDPLGLMNPGKWLSPP
ncbi:FAD-binding oxidoreductase [Aquitalea denitrificans]|uniref:FAD-binding oxidoreductase n=1 Tax=Aquitalea denitrificans TaxID=519081 RepID=UPI00135B4C3F|nr:FAD-binding oxidoreductase [Aquitalea denitrificans]